MIEAQQVLGTFDAPLREYAANKLSKQGLRIVKVRLLGYTYQKAASQSCKCFCLAGLGSIVLHSHTGIVWHSGTAV